MLLRDVFDVGQLHNMLAQGYVNIQYHPAQPLAILNYTAAAQYDRVWNSVTLKCRGLIYDTNTQRVVAFPFPKFFNAEEVDADLKITRDNVESITAKMDGSLFIAVADTQHGLVTATRGSFASEQANEGRNMLWAIKHGNATVASMMRYDHTYLFEVIYPSNRIVVNYRDRRELVLLAVIAPDGKEMNDAQMRIEAAQLGVRPTPKYDLGDTTALALKDTITSNEEGYVIKFAGGTRVKIKGHEYVRLHRILTNTSARTVWEVLSTEGEMGLRQLLGHVPDEFYAWVRKTADGLQEAHTTLMNYAYTAARVASDLPDRKAQAAYINTLEHPGLVFLALDRKMDKLSEKVWRMLRPAHELPFKENEDG